MGTPRSVTVVVTRLLERILQRFVTRGALFRVAHRAVVTACCLLRDVETVQQPRASSTKMFPGHRNYLFITCMLYKTHESAHDELRGRLPRSLGPAQRRMRTQRDGASQRHLCAEGGSCWPETMPDQSASLGGVSCTCQHQQGTSESPERSAERAEMGIHASTAGASSARRTVAAAAAAAAAATGCGCGCWLAGCAQRPAPERRECARSRRSGHIDTLNAEDSQPNKHTT